VLAVGVTVDAIPCVAISSVAVRSVRAIPVVERPIIGTAIITKSEAACAPLVAFARSPRLAASLADDENHEQSPAPVQHAPSHAPYTPVFQPDRFSRVISTFCTRQRNTRSVATSSSV
jgi:hypothetical protein